MTYSDCDPDRPTTPESRLRDAAEIVLRELDDNGQARAINDAIKEALK